MEELTPGLLSCDETRYFWVIWKDQFLEVGQGQIVGNQRFMHWQDDQHRYDVTAATIYTGDVVQPATWRFNLIEGLYH